MRTKLSLLLVSAALTASIFTTRGATFGVKPAQVRIDVRFVEISATGNLADPATGLGNVNYLYSIGRDDITVSQYTTFLNAVAKKDPYGLYTPTMATNLNIAGILQSATTGGLFTYSVIGSGRNPIAMVSRLNAARFCNWLHNGQPLAPEGPRTTEDGAYTLNGDTAKGLETKNPGARYWIPTLNEWFKAAYYSSTANTYYTYTTGTDVEPGNVETSPTNSANFVLSNLYAVTQSSSYSATQNYLTRVGLFRHSRSPWGTYDQGGDLAQLTDTTNPASMNTTFFIPGGGWDRGVSYMTAQSTYLDASPTGHYADVGFRVASTAVPIYAGNYAGLTTATNGIMFAGIQKNRAFTASLTVGDIRYIFSGKLTPDLTYSHTYTAHSQTLAVNLSMTPDSIDASYVLNGTKSYSAFARRDPYFLEGYPTRDAGLYNFLLLSDTVVTTATNYGFGKMTVTDQGRVALAGRLANGSSFSAGSMMTDRDIPLYAIYGKGSDSLAGCMSACGGGLRSRIEWLQPSGYASIDMIGSQYERPKPLIRVLDFLDVIGNGYFTAWGPGFSYLDDAIFTLGANNRISLLDTGPGSPTINLNPANGSITGQVWDTAFNKYVPFSGVVLPKQNIAAGYLQPGPDSGGFLIEPNPQFGGGVAGYGLDDIKILPKLEYVTPANGAKFNPATNPTISFSGIASDKYGIKSVSYQVLYDGGVSNVMTAAGTTQWSFSLTPNFGATGYYTVFVKAADVNGNESELVPRKILYAP